MSDDPAFDAWIARARTHTVRAELERRGAWSNKMLGDAGNPCPGCGGRDRFAVNLKKNLFFCRQSGVGGDAIALARHIDGTSFVQAIETLTGAPPPDRAPTETAEARVLRLTRLEDEARWRAKKAKSEEEASRKFRRWEQEAAHKLWLSAQPIAGTMAEAYLKRRGLVAPAEARLRYMPNAALYIGGHEHDAGGVRNRPFYSGPALAAAIQSASGHFIGLHRTWIDLDQPEGKLVLTHPETGVTLPAKKIRGSHRGGTIRLAGHAGDTARVMVMGEGIETTLSPYQVMTPDERAGVAFHAGVSLGNMSGKAAGRVPHPTGTKPDRNGKTRRVYVPDATPDPNDDSPLIGVADGIERLILLGDGDSDPFATSLAMQRAGARYAEAYPHLEIRLAMARPGQDFNVMLMEAA